MRRSEALAESIVHRYLTLVRYQRHFSGMLNKLFNISGRQLGILRYLVQRGPSTASQISRFLYVREATISPILERMERAGYITRRRLPEDNRKVLVEPTALGRDVLAKAPMGVIALLRTRLPDLSEEELETIDRALERLAELAEVDESQLD